MKILVLFCFSLLLQAKAFALGNEIGNGGDAISAQFISTGQFLQDNWSRLTFPKTYHLDVQTFADVVKTTLIETRDKTELNGREVDAINLPSQKRIIVSRSRWIPMSPTDRMTIVLHEYLGIISDADRNFEITPIALQGLNPEADVLTRLTSLLLTTVEVPASQQCPVLQGHWKKCRVESEFDGLNILDLSMRSTYTNGKIKYEIDTNIEGLSSDSIPGGRSTGENIQASCQDSILHMAYLGPQGDKRSIAEIITLSKNTFYMFLLISQVTGITITCEE